MCIRDREQQSRLAGSAENHTALTFHTQGQIKGINNKTWPDGWGFIGNSFEIKWYWENCLGLNWRRDVNSNSLFREGEKQRGPGLLPRGMRMHTLLPSHPVHKVWQHNLARDGEVKWTLAFAPKSSCTTARGACPNALRYKNWTPEIVCLILITALSEFVKGRC